MSKNKFGRVYVNSSIRAKKVRCIDQDNSNLGVIFLADALRIAEEKELDLVQFSNSQTQTPTCKILDYGKFKYEQSKKDKKQARKAREAVAKIKEIKFRPTTDIHDLGTKAKLATKFLADGCKIKITVVFRGREMAHTGIARSAIERFVDLVQDGQLESQPSMNGRMMTCFLVKVI